MSCKHTSFTSQTQRTTDASTPRHGREMGLPQSWRCIDQGRGLGRVLVTLFGRISWPLCGKKKKVLKKFEEFYHFVLFSRSFGIILWVMEVATVSTVSVLEVIPLIFWVTKMCCWQGKFGNVYNQAVQVISGLMVIAMMFFWIFFGGQGHQQFSLCGKLLKSVRQEKKKETIKKPPHLRPPYCERALAPMPFLRVLF